MPPSCAMTIAMSASVTVSIAAEITGMLSAIVARQPGAGVGHAGQDVALARAQQHVVEGQAEGDVVVCHRVAFLPGVAWRPM